jgi:hypothetical protein
VNYSEFTIVPTFNYIIQSPALFQICEQIISISVSIIYIEKDHSKIITYIKVSIAIKTMSVQQQLNTYDCGLYALAFAKLPSNCKIQMISIIRSTT